jgi:hypothetical protein
MQRTGFLIESFIGINLHNNSAHKSHQGAIIAVFGSEKNRVALPVYASSASGAASKARKWMHRLDSDLRIIDAVNSKSGKVTPLNK